MDCIYETLLDAAWVFWDAHDTRHVHEVWCQLLKLGDRVSSFLRVYVWDDTFVYF